MTGLTPEQKDRLLERIGAEFFGAPLDSVECEQLAKILRTEVMLRALGRLKAETDNMALTLVNANLGDEIERHQASVLQGIVRGRINAIEALMDYATLQEEEIDDASAPAE